MAMHGAVTRPKAGVASTTVIRCGAVLDVVAGRLAPGPVVIRGNRIEATGPTAEIPDDAATIDLGGATVTPGLFDVHTHLVDDAEGYHVAGPLTRSAAEMAYGAIPHARATLLAGFTSVRDVGTYRAFVDVALRDAIDAGIVAGPRMQVCGAYVTVTGGAGALTGLAPDIQLPLELRFGQADGPDQVRQRVRAIIRHGATLIKILATGAVLTPGSAPGAQEFTCEEMRAAVEEAEKAGLKVACHAHGAAGARDAIRAGVASIEHGSMLDDEALAMMKERGTFLVPDIYNDEVILRRTPADGSEAAQPTSAGSHRSLCGSALPLDAAFAGYPAEFARKERAVGMSQRRVMRRALEMGVRIAYGTDAAVIPHGDNGRQLASYVANGMTPLQAIRSATVDAADLMGWASRLGSVTPGKLADLIAVAGNPLDDVRLLERPVFVMKDGVAYRP